MTEEEIRGLHTDILLSCRGIEATLEAMRDRGNKRDVVSMQYLKEELERKYNEMGRTITILKTTIPF